MTFSQDNLLMEDGDGDEYLAQLAVDKTPRDCDADEQLARW